MSRAWIFLLIAAFIGNNRLISQIVLKGQITDSSRQPIAGVNVIIHQNKSGVISAPDGSYQIPWPGNLKVISVEYSFIGFKSRLETINLPEGQPKADYSLDIVLLESPLELQEVVVTAGFAQEQDRIPFPVATLMKKDVVGTGAFNLSQAIARTPGVYFSSLGNGVGKPVIRGLTNANLILLNNGIKLENFNFSSNHPFLIDEFNADRIEVIKGPASLQYGSDAVGGVINVVRERPANPQTIQGGFFSHYLTNTNGYLNSLGIKGSGKTLFWGLRASVKSHEDYRDGAGKTTFNTRFNESHLAASAGVRTNRGIFSLNYNYTRPLYGLQNQNTIALFTSKPELLTTGRENQLWYQNLTDHLFTSNNVLFLGKNTLDVDLGYQTNTREALGGAFNAQQQALTIPTFASMQLRTFTYNLKWALPVKANRFILGVNGAQVNNEADETKPNNPLLDSKINDAGIYAIGDWAIHRNWNSTAGLRYDYRRMESFPTATQTTNQFKVDNTYNNLTGSLGLTYNFADGQFLKANLALGFRSPTMPELTQNGIHASRYERGNPDLVAQRNVQADLNYHWHKSWLTVDVAPFYNIVNNYIYLVATNENAPIGQGKVFQHVQNDASLYGGEAALDIHPAQWLGIHSTYSVVRAEIENQAEGIKYPTFIPQDRLTGEIKLESKKLGFLNRPYIAFEVMHFFEQNRTGQNETVSPRYTLLHARIGTSLSLGKQSLDLFINGNNLTGEAYVDHLSVTKPLGLQMMGRNVVFGLRLPFPFDMTSK